MSSAKRDQGSKEQRPSLWRPPDQRDVISEDGKRWLEENAEAIKDWNAWIEKNGFPLSKYRPF